MSPNDATGLHVGIIMDGNGRWATARGLPRAKGHQEGVAAIRRTLEAAPAHGIRVLTLYAFSSDNWRRPTEEVGLLMNLLGVYLRTEVSRLVRAGVRLSVIGRRDRLPEGLADAITRAEADTAEGRRVHLRIALDYSSRDAILAAAERLIQHRPQAPGSLDRATFAEAITGQGDLPDIDLVIRTSGEQRLSDFMLWESAYAELHFTPVCWPDFGETDLKTAIGNFASRQRRFGALPDIQ